MLLLVLQGDQLWLNQEGRHFGEGGSTNANLMILVDRMQKDPNLIGDLNLDRGPLPLQPPAGGAQRWHWMHHRLRG